MKRKLFSTLLCALALLLLMGASDENPAAPLAIEEESTSIALEEQVLETGIPAGNDEGAEEQPVDEQSEQEELVEALPQGDPAFLIDGQPAPVETSRELRNGVTYVALAATAKAMDPEAVVVWDSESRTVTVSATNLALSAQVGQLYIVVNGRYLYVEDGVQMNGDRVIIPLRILTKAFDAKLSWDSATDTISVQRGSGAIVSGDLFYNQDVLFWLSRVIYAESGNQSLMGKMAVGNVVMNRVNSPIFPNSIQEVLAQKNQFSTYQGGKLANRTPNEGSVVAAKLVMDGGVVEETRGALYFDSLTYSWAARHKTHVATIGAHKFYC